MKEILKCELSYDLINRIDKIKKQQKNLYEGKIFKIDMADNSDNFIMFYRLFGDHENVRFVYLNDDLSDSTLESKMIKFNKDKIYYKNSGFGGFGDIIFVQYDEQTIWMNRVYNDEIILFNMKTESLCKYQSKFRFYNINFFYPYKYFSLEINKVKDCEHNRQLSNVIISDHEKILQTKGTQKIYKWENLLAMSENMESFKDIESDDNFDIVTIDKCIEIWQTDKNFNIIVHDSDLNFIRKFNVYDFFVNHYTKLTLNNDCNNLDHAEYVNYYGRGHHFNKPIVSINDNCLALYENYDLIDTKHWIVCNGQERIYCYDFLKDEFVNFKNRELDFFCTKAKPVRKDGKVAMLFSEYYPASSWMTLYTQDEESIKMRYMF